MLNKLTIFCYVDKKTSKEKLSEFKKEMNRNYPCNIILEYFDGKKAEWSERNGKKYLSDEYNAKMCKKVHEYYTNTVDMVGIFIDPKNWQNTNKRLLGTQFGKKHNNYYVFSCKIHRNYSGTGEHETLHAIDNYIKRYLGIKIERLFSVKDFDNDIVHAKEYWKKGYFYDDVWKKLSKVLSLAISKKRAKKSVLSITSIVQKVKESQYKASESIKETVYKYFSSKEAQGLNPDLVEMLDNARGYAGIPFSINSGLRSKEHNKAVGGVPSSEHLTGDGVDIRCRNSSERWDIVTGAMKAGFNRIGEGETFVHLGIGQNKTKEVIWTYYK